MQCPKCGQEMERRKHRPTETKHLSKPYYFSEWDYCKACRYVQHYEEYRVINEKAAKQITDEIAREVRKGTRKERNGLLFS